MIRNDIFEQAKKDFLSIGRVMLAAPRNFAATEVTDDGKQIFNFSIEYNDAPGRIYAVQYGPNNRGGYSCFAN